MIFDGELCCRQKILLDEGERLYSYHIIIHVDGLLKDYSFLIFESFEGNKD